MTLEKKGGGWFPLQDYRGGTGDGPQAFDSKAADVLGFVHEKQSNGKFSLGGLCLGARSGSMVNRAQSSGHGKGKFKHF